MIDTLSLEFWCLLTEPRCLQYDDEIILLCELVLLEHLVSDLEEFLFDKRWV